MSDARHVPIDEIQDAIGLIFPASVEGRPGQQWATAMWEVLGRAGLTTFRNGREHELVLIRLMSLAAIRSEFFEIIGDDYWDPDSVYGHWSDAVGISPYFLGQVVALFLESQCDTDEIDHAETIASACRRLADTCRHDVWNALVSALGGCPTAGAQLQLRFSNPGQEEHTINSVRVYLIP